MSEDEIVEKAAGQKAAEWHWHRGITIAIEGMKLLFILNGGSAIAVLAFIGKTHEVPTGIILSMVLFALGAFVAVLATCFAYLTQLHYGNSGHRFPQPAPPKALFFTNCTWVTIVVGGVLYLFGICSATLGFFCAA